MKATKVDGIYDSDPAKNPDAKFDNITYREVLTRDLKVMDATATALCYDNNMSMIVFDIDQPHVFISRISRGARWHHRVLNLRRQMSEIPIPKPFANMDKCLEALKTNFGNVRTGRANPHVLDSIMVDYYGQSTPITQLAGVKVPEASMLVVEPWDKTSLNAIEKAISQSDLGITPSNDGQVIRLPFPKPTERAPQGAREGVPHARRGSPRGHPQRPPRGQR